MGKLVISLLFVGCLSWVLSSSGNAGLQKDQGQKQLQGEWDWVYTKGEEEGESYHVTPESMNMNIRYRIGPTEIKIFINGNENEAYDYRISGDTLRFGQEEVLYEIREQDSLIFSNVYCCDDVYTKGFYKVK